MIPAVYDDSLGHSDYYRSRRICTQTQTTPLYTASRDHLPAIWMAEGSRRRAITTCALMRLKETRTCRAKLQCVLILVSCLASPQLPDTRRILPHRPPPLRLFGLPYALPVPQGYASLMGSLDTFNLSGTVAIDPTACEITSSNPERGMTSSSTVDPNRAQVFNRYFVARSTPFIAFGTAQDDTEQARPMVAGS